MSKATLCDAIEALIPNEIFIISVIDGKEVVKYENPNIAPTEKQIQAKILELQAAEPLRQLRQQRNQLLQQSDWMAVADRTMTQAQIDYRQALRDLPSTADPQLDENGQLTNVTWPSL
jgi:hypothetical protein